MKLRHLLFYLLFLVSVFAIGKLIKAITIGFWHLPETTLDYSIMILISVVVISGCYLIAVKLGLVQLGGFRGGNAASYWMLLFPVLFPGLILFKLKNYYCIDLSLFSFIFMINVFLMAIVEEILFRGIILGHLQKNYPDRSPHFHCIVSASIFSLVHLVNLQYSVPGSVIMQLVYSFFMGLFFAALMLRIRNVWLLGTTHGVLNLMTSNVCNEILKSAPDQGSIAASNGFLGALIFLLFMLPVLITYSLLINTYQKK